MAEPTADHIRCAEADDLGAILRIESLAFEPARRSSRASLLRALRSPFQRVLVLEVGAQVAGYLVIWPFRHTWRLYNLASDPSYRNRGVGGALLREAARLAEAAGARCLILESRDDPSLVRFYQQRGFRVSRSLPDYYAPGEHAVRMELLMRTGRRR